MLRGISIGYIVGQIGPDLFAGRPGPQHANQIEQQAEGYRQLVTTQNVIGAAVVTIGAQQMPHRVAQLLFDRLAGQLFAELPVLVDGLWDDPGMQTLGAFGFAVQEQP